MIELLIPLLAALSLGLLAYLGGSRLLSRADGAAPARGRSALFAGLSQNRWLIQGLLAVGLVLAGWFVLGSLLWCFLLAVAGFVLPGKYFEWQRKRLQATIDGQIPDVLAMMAGAIRAGGSLMGALDSVARDGPVPLRNEIDLTLREIRVGIDMDLALDHLAERVRTAEMRMVVAAIKIARESGGNLSESLDNLSRSVRDRQNMEKKVLALTAQGRMQALVMSGLPFFMLYMLHKLDPPAMAPMFNSVLGWAVFIGVLIWVHIGFRVIKKIMSIDI
ncbi:type II secretion system F family protein [Xenophilus sp. Marseille-Q4582]|uniref:type II secretion system F family protein n=1 Tax=Xenophilus sp. Marseille-Q4582 TaxID=2866600 RepID=UPI001CE4ABE2|nr:type II secretion system F family protein [Xenophilus sp. Marseille-Q4582]